MRSGGLAGRAGSLSAFAVPPERREHFRKGRRCGSRPSKVRAARLRLKLAVSNPAAAKGGTYPSVASDRGGLVTPGSTDTRGAAVGGGFAAVPSACPARNEKVSREPRPRNSSSRRGQAVMQPPPRGAPGREGPVFFGRENKHRHDGRAGRLVPPSMPGCRRRRKSRRNQTSVVTAVGLQFAADFRRNSRNHAHHVGKTQCAPAAPRRLDGHHRRQVPWTVSRSSNSAARDQCAHHRFAGAGRRPVHGLYPEKPIYDISGAADLRAKELIDRLAGQANLQRHPSISARKSPKCRLWRAENFTSPRRPART